MIQRILRPSNVAATQACYIKTASEDAEAAMQKLETALNDTYVTPRLPNSATKGRRHAVAAGLAPRLKGLNIMTDLMQVGKIVTGQQL